MIVHNSDGSENIKSLKGKFVANKKTRYSVSLWQFFLEVLRNPLVGGEFQWAVQQEGLTTWRGRHTSTVKKSVS